MLNFVDKIKYILTRIVNRRPSSVCNSYIHRTAKIGNGSQIVNTSVGRYTYIYESSAVNTKIGSFCSIAPETVIGGGTHPIDWVSTSPVFYRGSNVLKTNFSNNFFEEYVDTVIGNDVWIGSKCLVKAGVTIGNGAVIGMGSVVTHDVPPYEVWAGNPARFIKKRFDDETVSKLQRSKWWEMSDEELKKVGDKFLNPRELIEYLEAKEI